MLKYRDRQHADHDRQGQPPVEAPHEDEDDCKGDDRLQEPDQPEADEAANRRNVGDCAREQLPRLPVVVKRDLQVLQVGVEVVAEVGLHPERRDARVSAAEGTMKNELEEADAHEQARQPGSIWPAGGV